MIIQRTNMGHPAGRSGCVLRPPWVKIRACGMPTQGKSRGVCRGPAPAPVCTSSPPPPHPVSTSPRSKNLAFSFTSPYRRARHRFSLQGHKPSLCHTDCHMTWIKGRNCHFLVPLGAQVVSPALGLNPGPLSVLPCRASPPVTGSRKAQDSHPFIESEVFKVAKEGFPGGPVIKNPPANAGDTGLIPDLGRSHLPQSKPMRRN